MTERAPDPSEVFVSVDIEASGQSPGVASLLSIGACLVDRPAVSVYIEIKPLPDRIWDENAASVHGLARERLDSEGREPRAAMVEFESWLLAASDGATPIFVGFNAPFDWMFVADYFWRYLGRNPFGISALDLKSYFMAREGIGAWAQTRRVFVDRRLGLSADHSHHALEDAIGQAVLARVLLAPRRDRPAVGD